MQTLKTNTTYINSGNAFSSAFLVKENLEEKNLVVFDKTEDLQVFCKIWKYLYKTTFSIIDDQNDYVGFLNSNKGTFFCTKDLFELGQISAYDVGKNTIEIKRNEIYNPEDIIKKLIDFGFKYSGYLSNPGTYNREGDILNIRPKMGDYSVKISFFGDEIDDIFEIDTANVQNVKKIKEFKITNSTFTGTESKTTILDTLDQFGEFYKNIKTFLIGLDFYYGSDELKKNAQAIVFKETPEEGIKNLGIEPFSVTTIQELIETLKNSSKKIIYTKNEKTMRNFLEFNNISGNIEIIEIPSSMRYLESFVINNNCHSFEKRNLPNIKKDCLPKEKYNEDLPVGRQVPRSSQEGQTEEKKGSVAEKNLIKTPSSSSGTKQNLIISSSGAERSGVERSIFGENGPYKNKEEIELIDPSTGSGGRVEQEYKTKKQEGNINKKYNEDLPASRQVPVLRRNDIIISNTQEAKNSPLHAWRGVGGEVFGSEKKFESEVFSGDYNAENNIIYICDDILSDIFVKKRSKKSLAKNLDLLLEIRPGDYIVHIDHGIGKFIGIILKDLSGIKREYIEIEYRENDKLFVPISELHRISKYIGNEDPVLTRLNSQEWQRTMKNTEVEVERIAQELLEIYAKRSILKGFAFLPFPEKEKIFKDSFPYIHTPDQNSAIQDILSDMELNKPTERLIVGDVGFGKTEVAMNSIYKCFLNKKQTVFISPLVILAFEHFESLKKRFANFGLNIEILTRVTTTREESRILKDLANGKIDCIIGTHRLLSPDINFKNLGLVIIDEEHRFGVIDKEKLNKIKANIDTISLSATPIPRSLNFALNGIKDISIISTPPPKKQPIKTITTRWSDEVILSALKKELDRSGQILFIHNRIATIDATKHYLEKLIGKSAKIIITHGQMNGLEVEDRIIDFKNGKYNILLSTTVIENGVNFFNANTIIIDDADTFGLSQLHQLRGRTGRGAVEGICYLIYRKENLQDDAKKRLVTIVNNTHLGAGFEIAMRDLEIRGAGDILGIKQSGKSKETGLSLYLKLLEEKIEELKTGNKNLGINTQIELEISYYISEDFFSSESDKLHFFRNIESIETIEDLEFAHTTFLEGNDNVPEEFENLFLILRARIILNKYGVINLKKVGQSYIFEFDKNTKVEKIRDFLDRFDKGGDFVLITVHKIKAETRLYKDDLIFLQGLTD